MGVTESRLSICLFEVMRETGAHYMGLNLVPRALSYPSLRNERETLVASGHVAPEQI